MQLVVFILVFAVMFYFCYGNKTLENFVSTTIDSKPTVKFKRCDTLTIPSLEENVMKKFTKVRDESWDIYYPCGYTHVEKELQENEHFKGKNAGWVMGMDGADNFAAKDRLWLLLSNFYGRTAACKYVPQSWVTYDQNDLHLFKEFARKNPDSLFIMKKNIQRQEGLHIFSHADESTTAFANKYVVIQQVLHDPYLVNSRKINLRVYILVVCKDGLKSLYVYKDGFVYYSKVPYTTGTTRDEIITTGYVDRTLYERNPLTTKDLLQFIETRNGSGSAKKFLRKRDDTLRALMKAFANSFCMSDRGSGVVYAQTYGVDMQPNSDLSEVKIIEINKGADLSVKDERDGKLKQGMVDDVYRILDIVKDGKHPEFDKVWEGM